MPNLALTGSRIREQRLQQGLRQADIALRAGISASYLNLIEHNRRRVGAQMLQRLADALGLPVQQLESGAQGGLVEDLRSAVADAAMEPGLVEVDRLEEFAGRYPGWAALVAAQYRRSTLLERSVSALNDRMTHDPHLQETLHEVLSALSSVRATAGILAETDDLDIAMRARFQGNLHQDAERLTVGAGNLVAYLDGSERPTEGIVSPQDEVEAWLGPWGWNLGEVDAADAARMEREVIGLQSPGARALARIWIAQAIQDAAALPLTEFRAAIAEVGTDPALLAHRFGVGMLVVFRRLAMLPGSRFGLVVCDGSGTMVLRKQLEGFAMPRFGAACALWPLYTALSRPMSAVSAVVDTAGRLSQRFGTWAFCQVSQVGGFGGVELREAAMLIWPEPGHAGPGLAVGSTCRVCARAGCAARREPSILMDAE